MRAEMDEVMALWKKASHVADMHPDDADMFRKRTWMDILVYQLGNVVTAFPMSGFVMAFMAFCLLWLCASLCWLISGMTNDDDALVSKMMKAFMMQRTWCSRSCLLEATAQDSKDSLGGSSCIFRLCSSGS